MSVGPDGGRAQGKVGAAAAAPHAPRSSCTRCTCKSPSTPRRPAQRAPQREGDGISAAPHTPTPTPRSHTARAHGSGCPIAGARTWKHSQYFLRQALFLQLQPLECLAPGSATMAPTYPSSWVICTCAGERCKDGPGWSRGRQRVAPANTQPRLFGVRRCHRPGRRVRVCFCPRPRCRWSPSGPHRTTPARYALTWILGRKALGLRSRMASTAAWRVCSCSGLLEQLRQLHCSQ